ncbi:MAG: glycoside hydrolase family 3 C-terminal domain-containing protein, partial [Halorhabdus sp.]
DEAVTRILRVKERLGLFEDPFVDVKRAAQDVVTDRDHALARETAEQSMTVLEQGILPLDAPDTVLVTGPNADDPRAQHGGWTLGWQGLATETTPPTTTILEGIRQQAPAGTTVEHVPTGRRALSNEGDVERAAANADAVVAVLGEDSYAENHGDIDDLRLPAGQRRLLTVLDDLPVPTVGVLLAGRPRGGDHLFEKTAGLLMAYQPGSKGGQAVGKALFGTINPGGRLPFTWPAETGSIPVAATKRGPMPDDQYRFPIGHTDQYTTMLVSGLYADPMSIDPTETDRVTIEYTVENWGERRGDHLAAATIDRQGSDPTTTPWTRLSNFQRLSLDPGEQRSVSIGVPIERVAVRDGDVAGGGEWVVPAGTLTLQVGPQQMDVTVTDTVPLSALD